MFKLPGEAVGAISAAIIAGVVALLSLIISKEQKISEFRQQWIDALREDVSSVIACVHTIDGVSRSLPEHDQEAYWRAIHADFTLLIEATARMRLRLNRSEAPSKALLQAVNELQAISATGEVPDRQALRDLTNKVVSAAQVVLKNEWIRVRRGERIYQATTATTIVLIVALVLFLSHRCWHGC